MGFKSGLVVGLGVGYVLGAYAGRERYELMVTTDSDVADRPQVQDLVANGQALMDQANKAIRD